MKICKIYVDIHICNKYSSFIRLSKRQFISNLISLLLIGVYQYGKDGLRVCIEK